jgi:hypothetical protein
VIQSFQQLHLPAAAAAAGITLVIQQSADLAAAALL